MEWVSKYVLLPQLQARSPQSDNELFFKHFCYHILFFISFQYAGLLDATVATTWSRQHTTVRKKAMKINVISKLTRWGCNAIYWQPSPEEDTVNTALGDATETIQITWKLERVLRVPRGVAQPETRVSLSVLNTSRLLRPLGGDSHVQDRGTSERETETTWKT